MHQPHRVPIMPLYSNISLVLPSSSSRVILKGLSVSQIQRFIPKSWKHSPEVFDVENNRHILELGITDNASMIDNFFNSLKDFVNQGHLSEAFKTFSHIHCHVSSGGNGIIVSSISSLLLCCTKLKSFFQAKQLHALIISLGFEQHPALVSRLVTFYSTFNILADAHIIAKHSNCFQPLSWNILISSYVRNELFEEAISAYKQMVSKGITPDNFTYPSVLKACSETLNLSFGKEVHKSIDESCHRWNLFVHNSLVSMYGKMGELDFARHLFDAMIQRDSVSWNAMINGYASMGMWKEALELFEKMGTEGVEANILTWNTITGGCLRTGNFKGVLELLSQMRRCGIYLDVVAIIIGLGACSHIGTLKLGTEIHGSAVRSCFHRIDNVRNALITMYCRCRDLRHANILFRLMEAKDIITWNSMLSGYSHMDRSEEATFLFREMMHSGFKPTYVTIASILPLCARLANLQHGKEFHCYIMRRVELKNYLLLWNALVDMYARSGKVLEAKGVFDSMSVRDEVTYTSLISGYGIQGQGKIALRFFDEMNRYHIQPDHVTMVAVLTACSHSGLVAEGKSLFEKMFSVYNIIPRLEHYACMADLYGRAGLIYKAKEIITRMPYKPTPAMWATILGACRIHGNTEIGEWAAEKLLEMRPEHSGYYILIANIYAAAGSWNKLAELRTFMRDFALRKVPACAWVDVGSGFSPFLVGDMSKDNADEIYMLLEGLIEQMKYSDLASMETFCLEDELLEDIE